MRELLDEVWNMPKEELQEEFLQGIFAFNTAMLVVVCFLFIGVFLTHVRHGRKHRRYMEERDGQ